MKQKQFQINDIIYTKNGKVTGNLTVVDIQIIDTTIGLHLKKYICMSDYGNMVECYFTASNFTKYFYTKPGKASSTHKYYNYKENHPEEFI